MIEFDIAHIIDKDIKQNKEYKRELEFYRDIIKTLDNLSNTQISKSEISRRVNRNYSTTCNKLKILQKYGYISLDKNKYKVLKRDVENIYPFTIMTLVKVWKLSLDRHCDINKENKIMDILSIENREELDIAEGYFQYFSKSKDYDRYIMNTLS